MDRTHGEGEAASHHDEGREDDDDGDADLEEAAVAAVVGEATLAGAFMR
jgi:hypothetical protein